MVRKHRATRGKFRTVSTLATTFALFVLFGPALAAGSPGRSELHAAYAGHSIALAEVANHHCHDAMYPLIECFDLAIDRDLDLASQAASNALNGAPAALTTSYVTWYETISYGGSSFTASTSYSDLSTIGWDNRISSFKSLSGGRPKWWQNTGFTGTSWRWLAGAQVPDVGAVANDQFSSVANVP